MSSLTLDKYAKEVEQDHLAVLGSICWYSIKECRVDHPIIMQLLTDHGIGTLLIPKYPTDGNTFRRVTTDAKRNRHPIPDRTDVYENYFVRDLDGRGGKTILRRLVCEQVDANGKKLGYTNVMDIEFYRESGMVVTRMLPECIDIHQRNIGYTMAREIKDEYVLWRGKLGSYAIREFVRRVVVSLGGTSVRDSGAVYFVPDASSDKIKALKDFINDIPGDSSMVIVPLPDDREQRTMLKRAFQAETVGEIDAAMVEIMKAQNEAKQKGKKPSKTIADNFLKQFGDMVGRTKNYQSLLEDELHEIETRIPLFQKMVLTLSAEAERG